MSLRVPICRSPRYSEENTDGVHHAQQQQEAVEVAGLEIDGGQRHVEVHEAHRRRDEQADQQAGPPAQGLSGFVLFQLGVSSLTIVSVIV